MLWLHDSVRMCKCCVVCIYNNDFFNPLCQMRFDWISWLGFFFFILIRNPVENSNNKSFWFYFFFYFYLHFHFHWYLLRLLVCTSLNFFFSGKQCRTEMSYLCRMPLSGRQLKLTGFNLIITPIWFYCLLE